MKMGFFLAIFLWLIVIFSATANLLGWYKSLDGLDWVVHFLSGAWVAGASFYLHQRQGWKTPSFFHVLFWVLVVALAWEFHEFIGDRFLEKSLFQQSSIDTVGDLFFGALGGALTFLVRREYRRRWH